MQPAPIARVSTGQVSSNSSICNHCRKAIPPNVSIYTCLICSTAHITTVFCVWCFTANAVNMSHGHDKTYYVADSDPRVQLSVPDPTSHLWTIRKNVSGRLWYTHKSTGLKTHIKPTAAALLGYSGLPAGWEERRTPDGRTFYFNRKMGSSSWTKPANSLPDGWKELRTPDQVPFYINENLGLSTWDRPGQQPRKRPGQSNKVITRSRSGQPNNNQNAGDALLSATINAARLTGHGVEVASRQMGKLGKKKNWKKMGRIMTQASGLSMDSDGEGGGGNSSDDGGYEDQGQYQDNSGFQQAAFSDQQSFMDPNQAQPGYQQPVFEQQTYQYSAQQEQPVFEQPAYDNSGQFAFPGNEPQQGYEQQQDPQYQYGQNPAYDQEQQPAPQQPIALQEQPQYYTQEAQQQPVQQPVMPEEQPQYYPQEAQPLPTQQPVPQQPALPQEQPQYYTQEAQQQPVQQPVQQQVPQQPIYQPVPTQQPTPVDLVMPPNQNSDPPPPVPQEPQPAVSNQVPTTQAPMYTFQQPFFYDPTPSVQAEAPETYQSPVYSPTYIPPEQSQLPHNNQPEIITSDDPLVETYTSESTTIFVDNTSFVTGQPNAVNEPVGIIPDSQGDIVVEVTIQQQPEPLDVPGQSSLELISTPEPLIIQENDQGPDSVSAAQSTQLQGDMDASAACLALI
ncbi:hypothetical protein NCS52_00763000 [Fusarium sp. LHS14.1]|nr:hypothetical protein NCS52_00763000 [Fusarium sp. LHS14.1]